MSSTFTIFVCSTFSDLSAEREAVLDAIRRLKLQHDSMEYFGARTQQPLETCLQEVRASDMLVVIVGHRYGSLVPEHGISYSEAEYAEAIRLNKPCLIYMRDEDIPVLPRHIERDSEKLKMLELWKATLNSRHTVSMFQDGPKLAVQVAADVSRTIQDLEEAARTRADQRHSSLDSLIDDIKADLTEATAHGVSQASLLSVIRSAISNLILTSQKRDSSVFLSYVREDSDIVLKVAHGLRAAGIQVWMDHDIKAGDNWREMIERRLSSATFVVVFISKSSADSQWVRREWMIAMLRQMSGERGARILPVLLEKADVPPLLRQFQWLDMRDKNYHIGIQKLVETIHHWSSGAN
jgi:hypothetical protein